MGAWGMSQDYRKIRVILTIQVLLVYLLVMALPWLLPWVGTMRGIFVEAIVTVGFVVFGHWLIQRHGVDE